MAGRDGGVDRLVGRMGARNGGWPDRPVRVIVASAAAGGTDALARVLAEQLGMAFGKPFVVENKPGANGLIASETVANAKPDGYTLLFTYAGAIVVNPSLYRRAQDPLKRFEPIALVGSFGNLLVASPTVPVHNIKELIDYAKRRPGQLSYGSWGIGSGGHLTMETFLKKANIAMTHAPYKGTAAVATDLQSGTLPVGWVDVSSQIGLVKAGRLVPLAVSGTTRMPQFPDVPTMGEQGYPFATTSWYGMFAPAGTPKALVDRLNQEVLRAIATPAMRERLTALNLPVAPALTPAQFRNVVADDTLTWHRIVQATGLKPE
ncbi:Bug family tripartite tricarboxylate transporter substrate binding protein [Cupriavidus sp. D39]|uniref:Bug family tripartite tricarboxylate transporter substrate binding protein n=1 Tax=Cupriavidus sp. D39 TaxID=2997877 RepID=UPI00226DEC94|nr:tripartite tricarboxylate transporter substrate binding protein [Cupriavidus sp. D39]MCY0854128.1 tripartite tricarboxylate transporter substrate binding protein [Cupriavidus sp. D39]